MRWYKHLYVGEKAKKRRFSIIQGIRLGRLSVGVHVITPPSNPQNVLDIYPASVLLLDYYKNQKELLILGIGADYEEALMVAGQLVTDLYRTTGGFSLWQFLEKDGLT